MIIGSYDQVEVGSRRVGVMNADGKGTHYPEQPYIVMREATLAEYEAEWKEHGLKFTDEEHRRLSRPGHYFYEVSLD